MMLSRRQAIMAASKRGLLPPEYVQCEYLENVDDQNIIIQYSGYVECRIILKRTDERNERALIGISSSAANYFGADANGNFEINYTEVELRVKSTYINTDDYVDATTKNNLDLVNWANNAYENKWGYVCGTFGNVLTSDAVTSKVKQYPDAVAPYEDFIRKNWVGKRTADCVGLIKGYCWFNAENEKIEILSIHYENNIPKLKEKILFQRRKALI